MFPLVQLRKIDFQQLEDGLNEFSSKRSTFYRVHLAMTFRVS